MTDPDNKRRPVTVTRDQLHAEVWADPISHLAERYGTTGTGLAKICDRLNIPRPPRGYWAKVAAGKAVTQHRLPPADHKTPTKVTIAPTPPRPKPLGRGHQQPREGEGASRPLPPVTVPARLTKPHPVIGRWVADHNARVARAKEDPWGYSPAPLTATTRRKYRLLDGLFKALEKAGGAVTADDHRDFSVDFDGEKIVFRVREKQRRIRRPLTESEKRWRVDPEPEWRYELQPTGKFVLEIRTYFPEGVRREWLETDDAPMEGLLPEVVQSIVGAVPILAERTRQRVEAERQRQIAERERYEAEKLRKRDDNRWRRFGELAKQWQQTGLARDFVAGLRATDIPMDTEVDGKPLSEWLDWVDDRLNAADPINYGAEPIFRTVAAVNEWTYRD